MGWRDRIQWPRPRRDAVAQIVQSARRSRNPSSLHQAGRRARRDLDALAEVLLDRLGVGPRDVDVVLTGGGVEAMQIAHESRALTLGARSTAIARAVVPASAAAASEDTPLAVLVDDRDGSVEWTPGPVVDATLALGRVDLTRGGWGASVLVFAGELCGGPPGIGALVRPRGAPLTPLWGGGGQEHGVRPGTQPVALAAGWAHALSLPPPLDRMAAAGRAVSAALDRRGLEIIKPPETAAGIVVARGPELEPVLASLALQDVHPARLDTQTMRFAVDADDEDDDIERLIAAIDAA